MLRQNFSNYEIIVHDNASEQDPTPIVESFADPRLRIYRNDSNIGQTANIIEACSKAVGEVRGHPRRR